MVLAGLDSVNLKTIPRFAMRSKCWILAYFNGLIEEQRESAEITLYLSNIYDVHTYIFLHSFSFLVSVAY
jgi:hypothetical protein